MKKKLILILTLFFAVGVTPPARAFSFGADVAVLTQILAQAIMQLQQLRNIMGTATSQLDLIRQINQGINDSLHLLRTIDPNIDPGIYKNWDTVNTALGQLQSIYGGVVNSPDAPVQRDLDQGIAEAVAFNNNYYKYTNQLDELGEQIKTASHAVSPGGASKLTAEALGLVIQVLNQNLRAQATGLKLHAQELAVQNRKDKEETKHFLNASSSLKTAMQNEKIKFEVPRF